MELDACLRAAEEDWPDLRLWAEQAADALRALAPHPRAEPAAEWEGARAGDSDTVGRERKRAMIG